MKRFKDKFFSGKFIPRNPEKYIGNLSDIIYRSSWEKLFMEWCDLSSIVSKWTSEYPILYLHPIDGRFHRYFVDFIVELKDGEKTKSLVIEIKPESKLNIPDPPKKNKSLVYYKKEIEEYLINQSKWKAAREFAENNNAEFIVLTEQDLKIFKRKNGRSNFFSL